MKLTKSFPARVYPAETTLELRTELDERIAAEESCRITIRYIRDDWRRDDLSCTDLSEGDRSYWQEIPLTREGRLLRFPLTFHGEHEHTLVIIADLPEGRFSETHSFYSLNEDLALLKPYKGNIHTHSTQSDGLVPPLETACIMRRSGFDFFSLTDHCVYTRELEFLERSQCGFVCYPGEEAQTIPGVNHVLSLGVPFSITRWRDAADSDYSRRVRALEDSPPCSVLPPHERNLAAQTEILFRKIRESGGVSVFCHPYWFCENRFYSTVTETDFLLRNGSYDALEVGNSRVERMALLNAKLKELAGEGAMDRPLVGSSDWHGREGQLSNKDYTVIFAASPDFSDFAAAVRAGRCVGVGGRQDEFAFGSFRLVKYTYFLIRHFFAPLHDPLCEKQGEALLRLLKSNAPLSPEISDLRKEIESLYLRFFPSAG